MDELRERIKTLKLSNQMKVEIGGTNTSVVEKVVNLKHEENVIVETSNNTNINTKDAGKTEAQQQQQQHQQPRGDDGLIDEESNPERRLQSRSHNLK